MPLASHLHTHVLELFLNFLLVLNEHERLGLLQAIRDEYQALRDQRARRLRVQVQSPVPLPEDQRQRLTQELRAQLRTRRPSQSDTGALSSTAWRRAPTNPTSKPSDPLAGSAGM